MTNTITKWQVYDKYKNSANAIISSIENTTINKKKSNTGKYKNITCDI